MDTKNNNGTVLVLKVIFSKEEYDSLDRTSPEIMNI